MLLVEHYRCRSTAVVATAAVTSGDLKATACSYLPASRPMGLSQTLAQDTGPACPAAFLGFVNLLKAETEPE